MIWEPEKHSQEPPESWILPLTDGLRALGVDSEAQNPSKPSPTDAEPLLRSDEFPGWDTMIMALMA